MNGLQMFFLIIAALSAYLLFALWINRMSSRLRSDRRLKRGLLIPVLIGFLLGITLLGFVLARI